MGKELLYKIKAHIYVIVQLPFKIFYFVFYTISLHILERSFNFALATNGALI